MKGAARGHQQPFAAAQLASGALRSGVGASASATVGASRLPEGLRISLERLSGLSLRDVRVHHGSAKPAQLCARAYAQGSQIHLAPGQERHLPHEAWHVVQQKQGRVPVTRTLQGRPINDHPALEREADQMGARAAATAGRMPSDANAAAHSAQTHVGRPSMPVLQGVFDWVTDLRHNKRKVGVEITEATEHANRIYKAAPGPSWAAVLNKPTLWQHAQLPDHNGAAQQWRVARWTDLEAHFERSGSKSKWMKWNHTLLTEDYGEYEWIIEHPDQPQGVTEYRRRLEQTAAARTAFRAALAGLGLGTEFLIANRDDPGANDAFYVNIGATQRASSQVTFEAAQHDIALSALVDGLSFGLDRQTNVLRMAKPIGVPVITNYLNQAIRRVPVAGTNMALPVTYLLGDLAHKVATMISGAAWGGDIAANFKDWRILFPKSHPYYITQMAIEGNVTAAAVAAIRNAIDGAKNDLLRDLTEMLAAMIHRRGPRLEWGARGAPPTEVIDRTSAEYHRVNHDLHSGAGGGTHAQRTDDLEHVIASGANATFLGDEFDSTLNAMTDSTMAQRDVVRSSTFATHGANDKAFAFEDRGEVQDAFPELSATYARVVEIVDRY